MSTGIEEDDTIQREKRKNREEEEKRNKQTSEERKIRTNDKPKRSPGRDFGYF